mgnify:FL=1|jgi:hypothetical protein
MVTMIIVLLIIMRMKIILLFSVIKCSASDGDVVQKLVFE